MAEKEMVKFKAVVFWSCHNKKNALADKYTMDLCQLSDAACKAIEETEVEIKNKGDEQGNFVTVKSEYPITVLDSSGNNMSDTIIGNGSEVIVVAQPYSWKFKNKKGVSLSPKKIVLTKLVTFDAMDPEELADFDKDAL